MGSTGWTGWVERYILSGGSINEGWFICRENQEDGIPRRYGAPRVAGAV